MNMQTESKEGFWAVYTSNVRSIGFLIVVCIVIASATNIMNGLGYWQNLIFSFCYGFPISLIETQMRLWRRPLPEYLINILSVLVGSFFGTSVVYYYLVKNNIVPFGEITGLLIFNFGFGFAISAAAFYFFWSRYRNQTLTLALRDQQLKAAELENLKQQAEYRLLQSQMEPHFLFNTLANIQSLIDIDAKAAKNMVNDLSQMLRASLKNSSQEYCTVEQEINLVRAYLGIQSVRMGERLIIKETIAEDVLTCPIIPMIIQPLVENSIKHGVEKSTGTCNIELVVERDGDKLGIYVSDDCLSTMSSNTGHGISLKNIKQRINTRYGEAASLVSEQKEHGWVTHVSLPIQQPEETS
jgi:sensor histidine kinase YesM